MFSEVIGDPSARVLVAILLTAISGVPGLVLRKGSTGQRLATVSAVIAAFLALPSIVSLLLTQRTSTYVIAWNLPFDACEVALDPLHVDALVRAAALSAALLAAAAAPCASTVTLYSPTGSVGLVNKPSPLDCVLNGTAVPVFRITTAAPAIALPAGSDTLPRMVPPPNCAPSGSAETSNRASASFDVAFRDMASYLTSIWNTTGVSSVACAGGWTESPSAARFQAIRA